ncbi:MAG: glycosyltransferase family 2 protein [Sphingobacteriaceae bacterium]|nr:MAG: glycosyltransferase family 2 protein [Sphingobacteriaceae bacterium]
MENKPLVSIALCTYNGAKYLAQQLDTIVNQTYKKIELVVVDDCSTDETVAILQAYAAKYPHIKLHNNSINLGFVKNFERAAQLCTGELIALCDQDDLWLPEKIALQVDAIKDNVFVYHDSEFVYEDGTSMNKKMSDVINFYRGDEPEVFLFFNCVSGHAILMKKELLQEALPLKADYFHDWWLAYVATNIGRIDFLPQALVKYRQHEKSDTNILRLKRSNDKYKFSSPVSMERTRKWLSYCAAYPKNKHPELVDEIYRGFINRMNSYMSFKLAGLLFKYRETIFFIQKKSSLSKLNYIYKQIWGLKTKKKFAKN